MADWRLRVWGWLRAAADRVYEMCRGRTRPATHRRREEAQIQVLQRAIADTLEARISLAQQELDMLWERYGQRVRPADRS